jgi:hypothetical protein
VKRFSIRRSRSRVEEASEDRHQLQTDGVASRPERDPADQEGDLSPLGEVKRDTKRRSDSD